MQLVAENDHPDINTIKTLINDSDKIINKKLYDLSQTYMKNLDTELFTQSKKLFMEALNSRRKELINKNTNLTYTLNDYLLRDLQEAKDLYKKIIEINSLLRNIGD